MNSFINQALFFIASAVILVPIFHKLGLGSILGYLVAGIIVGPFGLSLIHETDMLKHFAELGVILLLFIIGLEIQPKKLWSMRRRLFGLGNLQIFLCSLIFMAIAKYFGVSTIPAAVIGFGLSLSSTAFALQTLTDKSQLDTEYGQSSFAVLLMQDLIAIPALAIIPTLSQDESAQGLSLNTLAMFIAIIIGLVLVSRFLIRPAFRIISATRIRELFTAITLVIVLGVASLMLSIGLSAALGTFIAGVLLADSEYRHELEADLGPFKNLLMGLFFIGVGMSVNLDLIISRPLLIIGLSIGYILLKMLLVYLSGRIFKLSRTNSKLMALTVGQGGEFAFVIFGIALTYQMADPDVLAILTVVISISMALSPILLLLNDKYEAVVCKEKANPTYDQIQNESPEVIIAGFGRFGQIFGRILRTQKIPFTAIDRDPNQIELVRKFGNKVYYGDASRLDIMEAAGVAKAKYFVIALDDVSDSVKTAQTLKEHFPHVKIYARSRNRGHTFDLMDQGVQHIKREVFDSSLNFTSDLLKDMGMDSDKVDDIIRKFAKHDVDFIAVQHKVRNDEKMFMSAYNQAQAQLAEVLSQDEKEGK
ncbi:monovalent cation:proton antiporter-2 (CPA2) family protein [Bacteriovorax sp. PP10]|uniref:Monovalent cation:proton antiporter-2 (CPA2) family protein n=1 Tax=Bacteriovorax antarcticus TaxID=3088717 RepID=A0ABU5VZQ3_9BACT|nr:monovalent cation:proton antiporter-2 (CPA2) family protein [Bacteriovorax sp. PP10]MEA9358537.1 monovalent cation:proton antiporter-2 (CPA2) family protein [Bacteriovorax sp. PP10]